MVTEGKGKSNLRVLAVKDKSNEKLAKVTNIKTMKMLFVHFHLSCALKQRHLLHRGTHHR